MKQLLFKFFTILFISLLSFTHTSCEKDNMDIEEMTENLLSTKTTYTSTQTSFTASRSIVNGEVLLVFND